MNYQVNRHTNKTTADAEVPVHIYRVEGYETDADYGAARYHAQKQGEEDADHALPVIVWVLGVVLLTLVIILTATPFWLPRLVEWMGG